MRWSGVGFGVAAAIGLARFAGCSVIPCYYGVAPYDGQTGVPTDVVVTFDAGEVLPRDLPRLADGITFERIDGGRRAVAFTVSLDAAAGIVSVTPDAPLQEGASYEVSGIVAQEVDTVHQISPLWRDETSVQFSTGSDPTLIGGVRVPGEGLMIVLSEAVPLDDVQATLVLTDGEGYPVEATVVATAEDHIFQVDESAAAVEIAFEGRAPLPIYDDYDGDALLKWYRSEPVCTDAYLGGSR